MFGRMNPSIDFKGGMRGASSSAAAVMNPSFMGQNNGVHVQLQVNILKPTRIFVAVPENTIYI